VINRKCTADIFVGVSYCLCGIRGECVLSPKCPFIIIQKTKEKGKRDISMPNNENKQNSHLMRERRAK
jgi:hypothetical protein